MLVVHALHEQEPRGNVCHAFYLTSIPWSATVSSSSSVVLDRPHPIAVSLQPHVDAQRVVALDRGPREAGHAITAVGGRQHLHVVLVCGAQDHPPEAPLDGVVEPVLRLVDDQEAVAAVGQGQRGGEQARDAVAEALQGNRARMLPQFRDHAAAAPGEP